jgi:cytochrome c oxidase assembly factor CtaG
MRRVLLAAGLIALPAAAVVPDRTLTGHMVEHLLIGVLAPLLVAAGAPIRTLLPHLRTPTRRRLVRLLHHPAVRALGRPAVSFPASIAVLLGVHLTPAFTVALRNPWVHATEHAALFWTGLIAWAGLLGVDPVGRRSGAIARLAWVTAVMGAMAAVGATFLGSDRVLFPDGTASVADQHSAGTVMWLAAMGVLVPGGLAACAHELWCEEQRQRRREAVRS